jgi:hypothetical protein
MRGQHLGAVFRDDQLQKAVHVRLEVLRIDPEDAVHFRRPSPAAAQITGVAAHMGQPLRAVEVLHHFAQPRLARAQVGHILERDDAPGRPAVRIMQHGVVAMDHALGAIRPDDPIFQRGCGDAGCLAVGDGLADQIVIVGVNKAEDEFRSGFDRLGFDRENRAGFGRPCDAPGVERDLDTADPGHASDAVEAFGQLSQLDFGLLEAGDIDAQPGRAAVAHAMFGDQQMAPIRQPLFDGPIEFAVMPQALGKPGVFAACCLRKLPVGQPGSGQFGKTHAVDQRRGAGAIKGAESLVAHHETVVGIEDHEGLRDAFDRVVQRLLRDPRGELGVASPRDLGLQLAPLFRQFGLVGRPTAKFPDQIDRHSSQQKGRHAGPRDQRRRAVGRAQRRQRRGPDADDADDANDGDVMDRLCRR